MSRAIATVFGLGLLPGAPGTWASLAALPAANLIHVLAGFPGLLIATCAVFALGLWAVAAEIRDEADRDPGEIVVDEIVGQWIALFPLSAGLWWMGSGLMVFPWPGFVAGFVLFRFFDILKPPPVRWADRLGTPLGVMLDDVLAGLISAVLMLGAAALAHGWLR